ncbi:MAG TPA: FAD-dependent oxidoreductase [Amnibacterium sp.]|uniref:FAD-dependent oxidoreductase n=1 Tax=Amnibacterium sp. TaxID=1872496 RepID=UPI002F95D1C4
MTDTESGATTVAISGGGPAGVMLGLLLARQGVEVTVLEKHADFLRDFRGDTVHPSTQVILDQLGLLAEFDTIARGRMTAIDFGTTDGPLVHQPLDEVNPRHPFHEVALAPQWDLLDLLVRHARTYPTFRLEMEAETVSVVRSPTGPVRGIRYRKDGQEHELRAVLTVDAEGRGSRLRSELRTEVLDLGSAIDVEWFRIPRVEGDPAELRGVLGRGGAAVAINRADYWQVAFIVAKGADAGIRAAGLEAFRKRVGGVAPWMRDRLPAVTDWGDVKLLSVGVERLKRWSAPGVLAIGDAAHTMSPMGGIGINLAIGDAVATANLLGADLLAAQADPRRFERTLNPAIVDRVERRRRLPAEVTQRIQVAAQNRIIAMTRIDAGRSLQPPAPVRALLAGPVSRLLPRIFVYGIRPELIAG